MDEAEMDAIVEEYCATLEYKMEVLAEFFDIRDAEIKAQLGRIDAALLQGVPRPAPCPTP